MFLLSVKSIIKITDIIIAVYCIAYIGNTSNLDSNHFVHQCIMISINLCVGRFLVFPFLTATTHTLIGFLRFGIPSNFNSYQKKNNSLSKSDSYLSSSMSLVCSWTERVTPSGNAERFKINIKISCIKRVENLRFQELL